MAAPVIVFLPDIPLHLHADKDHDPAWQTPFAWDPLFEAWDLGLHGGQHPWVMAAAIAGPCLGDKDDLFSLCRLGSSFCRVWSFGRPFSVTRPRLRMQFFLTFILTWALLGSIGGTLFASAGPVYYAEVTGLPDPYLPLLEYLQSLNANGQFGLIEVQAWLWGVYEAGDVAQFSGISAMPSMHVAMVTIFALLAWRVHWVLGWTLHALCPADLGRLNPFGVALRRRRLCRYHRRLCHLGLTVGAVLRRCRVFSEQPRRGDCPRAAWWWQKPDRAFAA